MADNADFKQNRVLIAIDIAKHSHDVVIRYPRGRDKTLKIPNSLDGYHQLLSAVSEHIGNVEVMAAFEPTADFHRNIAHWLHQRGITCHLASSLGCARAREMLFKTWDKHDRKDARVILYLLEHGMTHPFYDPLVEGGMDIQELCNTYQQVVLARSRCVHSLLNHHLTLYFPEMERFYNSSRTEWFCDFLLQFPTPSAITRYRKETFVRRAWDVVGRKVSKQRFLEEVYETAETSIGLPVPLKSPAIETFKLQIRRNVELTQQRRDLEALSETLLSERADYKHLRSLPGVGPIIALIILAESGDLARFGHYRQYLNFCGFNLCALQSGQSRGTYHLSKRGNARLRYAFWLAANAAIKQQENSFRWKYDRCIKANPDDANLKRKARTAVAVKIARVAHALIKCNTDYRGYHELGRGT